ncbi:hypothetical protein EV421DRAFT_2033626 [Armillaria borealis]|uniref:Uncharacterized protein n=1 Tax=Armillaria borealis TaxID=47425 RepID=A0AA39MVD7_9AGAR|nr:hypothetical protein EV421DRAFT_2033626 [Armillaria borealis]
MQPNPSTTQDFDDLDDLFQELFTLEEWETELMTEYPSLFSSSDMQEQGLKCGEGWDGLIREICEELKGKDVVFSQIKEKFGQLRIYVEEGDEETLRYLLEMEEKSAKVCEECGAAGNLAESYGWLFATCEECAKKGRREYKWVEDVQKERNWED